RHPAPPESLRETRRDSDENRSRRRSMAANKPRTTNGGNNMSNLRHLGVAAGAILALTVATGARADDVYIPLISKGFQHQFWQAVKVGAEQAAKANNVKITLEGPETEAMVDKQIDMLSAALAKKPQALGFAALD